MQMRVALCIVLLSGLPLSAEESPVCEAASVQFKSGDVSGAQNALWDCVKSRLGDETHALYLAETYRELRNYDSGLTRVDALLKERPDNIDLLCLAAYLRYRRNEPKESMLLVSKAYKIAPENWRIHQLFALNYISFNMLEAAKLSLLKAIDLNPRNAELRYQLARLYFTLGSYVESIAASKEALAIFPDYPEVYHNLALSYEGNGNVDLATANFEKAIELDRKYGRKDESPLIDFAVYQRMQGSPEAGLPLLQEALAINPRSPKANYEMGELLRDMKRYEESKKYLELTVSLDPCNARALYGLAMITSLLGHSDRSDALLKRFKEVDARTKNPAVAGDHCDAATSGVSY
jgi:tetratricopeptide (TPR) repeat protein